MSVLVVIPIYNHGPQITPVLNAVVAAGLPCLLVDDGSGPETRQILTGLAGQHSLVDLAVHPENRGKGAAVITGLLWAREKGYASVLQIDADGQHDTGDLPRFVDAARAHPDTLVVGKPRFDESVPKHRFYCRYLTHVLVWVECLSLEIADTMCGYRIYPVPATCALIDRKLLPPRMDFDTEAAVRLYWAGTPVQNLSTRVRYPENGLSNFRMFKDNLRMIRMHIRLVIGMLIRAPRLLARRWSRGTERHG